LYFRTDRKSTRRSKNQHCMTSVLIDIIFGERKTSGKMSKILIFSEIRATV
jgi:hypothetical protein